MNVIYSNIVQQLLTEGKPVETRGTNSLELMGVNIVLEDPRSRLITNGARKFNMALAAGELAWHLSGSADVSFISYYAKNWAKFSDDGEYIRGSCYGHSIFTSMDSQPSQWVRVKQLLQTDPQSRRAVLLFYNPDYGLDSDYKDVACTMSMQFLLREGRLNCITYMRSNDVIWGLPYDIFLFTVLQELMALEIGVEVGTYQHIAGSLHLYDYHIELAKRIVGVKESEDSKMPPIHEVNDLKNFLEWEEKIRNGSYKKADLNDLKLSAFWSELLDVFVDYEQRVVRLP